MNTEQRDTYGKWTVLSFVRRDKKGNDYWMCGCDCGKQRVVSGNNLRRGVSKSCGCIARGKPKSHGHCCNNGLSSEYRTWRGMHRRCYYPSDIGFAKYGAKGIQVCVRWHKSNPDGFHNFVTDMGFKPNPKLSIDRINNDFGYMPSNCRWATASVQSRNRRRTESWPYTLKIECEGRTKTIDEWAQESGIRRDTIYRRLLRKWDSKSAIFKPAFPSRAKQLAYWEQRDIGGNTTPDRIEANQDQYFS